MKKFEKATLQLEYNYFLHNRFRNFPEILRKLTSDFSLN